MSQWKEGEEYDKILGNLGKCAQAGIQKKIEKIKG